MGLCKDSMPMYYLELFHDRALEVHEFLQKNFDYRQFVIKRIIKLAGLSTWGGSFKVEVLSINHSGGDLSQEYVLRVCNKDQPTLERKKEIFLMQLMGKIGISPKVIVDNSEDLVLIEYIKQPEEKPWHVMTLTNPKLKSLAQALRIIHRADLPKFISDKFYDIDKTALSVIKDDPRFEIFRVGYKKMQELERFICSYIRLCLAHNDLGHGGNLLWDGSKAWIIDWELATTCNPLFDLAAPVSLLLFTTQQRKYFYTKYFGHMLTELESGFLYLSEQYALLRYGISALSLCSDPVNNFKLTSAEIDNLPVWDALRTGAITVHRAELAQESGRCKIGVMLIKQALSNMLSTEYTEYRDIIQEQVISDVRKFLHSSNFCEKAAINTLVQYHNMSQRASKSIAKVPCRNDKETITMKSLHIV